MLVHRQPFSSAGHRRSNKSMGLYGKQRVVAYCVDTRCEEKQAFHVKKL